MCSHSTILSYVFFVLRVSSYLCAAYLYYSAAMTQILRALAAPTQLVPDTAFCCPMSLKSQWWRSHSGRPPSTVDLPTLTCPHQVHPTGQAIQACPSKPFFNDQAKCCEPYLPSQSIFKPTCQAKTCDTSLSFLNRLPAPPRYFQTDTPIQSLWSSPVIPQHINCPSNTFSNQQAKRHEPVPYFSSDHLTLQAIFEPTRQALWASPIIPHQSTCP